MSDLISRQAARNAVRNFGEDYVARLKMLLLIEEIPSAEPKERTAKVKNYQNPIGMGGYGDCSECGAEVNEQYTYCPNCGVRLEWE